MAISLFVAGDFVPKGIQPDFLCNKGEQIFAEMRPHITRADFSIVNLEAPVIKNKPTPIKKNGPCLGMAASAISVLNNAGFGIFTLANNHFFDQGQEGVENTINECNSFYINVVGGGKTALQARKPLFLEKGGRCLAIINACEHEFSIANADHGGSNPLDLINIQEDIAAIRNKVDYVVLILHGGVELYHYPTPRMKHWYRHFIDLGADVVINHHQHCINGYEVYKGKPIFYGLGNFYFPWNVGRPESWKNGYAVSLTLGNEIDFELIPYKQTKEAITLRAKDEFDIEIDRLNLPIQDDFLLQQKFDEHLLDIENYLKSQILPSFLRGKIFTHIVGKGLFGKLYKEEQIFNVKNKLACESHHESLLRLFTLYTKH